MFLAPPERDTIPVHPCAARNLPRRLVDFWVYYWRFDPKRWSLFLVQDILHFSRFHIAYLFVGIGIDALASAQPGGGIPATAIWMAWGVLVMLAFGEAMHVWTAYIMRTWQPQLREKIRKDFLHYCLGHSHAYFQDNFAGTLTRKITEVAESGYRLHDTLRFMIVGSLISMVIGTAVLFTIDPLYGVGMLVFVLSITLPIGFRLDRIKQRSRYFSQRRADVTGAIVDMLTNIDAMRNFARTAFEQQKHHDDTWHEKRADSKRILTLVQIDTYRRISLTLLGGGMFFALLYGWQYGRVSVGDVSAIMGICLGMVGPAWMFGRGIVMVADELGYIDDAMNMIVQPHDVPDIANAQELGVTHGHITFDNVDFNYTGQPVFKDMSVDIPARQHIGLIGPSGAGKSTLVSLLLRLYDIQGGRILIDGQDIAQVTQSSLRSQIAVIPQDTALFHRSLMDNIRYGRLEASDEEVIEAAKQAHADDFIREMPDGYDTLVGERGVKLSGGQRQRIAIARAILKDAPILVLDEATSSLDSESEQAIQKSLVQAMAGKTVIAIAHRLSTIAHLDRLIVMDAGHIVEDGTHDELLANNDLYARLWRMQSGGFLVDG